MSTKRQSLILAELQAGKPVKEIAALANCTPRYVQKVKMKPLGKQSTPRSERRSTPLAESVLALIRLHPEERDQEIAARVGCCDEHVRVLRNEFLPETRLPHPGQGHHKEKWMAAGLETKSVEEVAQALGVCTSTVYHARHRYGVTRQRGPNPTMTIGAPAPRTRQPTLDWSEIDPLLTTWNVNWLAAKFKRSKDAIKKRKKKLAGLAEAAARKEEKE